MPPIFSDILKIPLDGFDHHRTGTGLLTLRKKCIEDIHGPVHGPGTQQLSLYFPAFKIIGRFELDLDGIHVPFNDEQFLQIQGPGNVRYPPQ